MLEHKSLVHTAVSSAGNVEGSEATHHHTFSEVAIRGVREFEAHISHTVLLPDSAERLHCGRVVARAVEKRALITLTS